MELLKLLLIALIIQQILTASYVYVFLDDEPVVLNYDNRLVDTESLFSFSSYINRLAQFNIIIRLIRKLTSKKYIIVNTNANNQKLCIVLTNNRRLHIIHLYKFIRIVVVDIGMLKKYDSVKFIDMFKKMMENMENNIDYYGSTIVIRTKEDLIRYILKANL